MRLAHPPAPPPPARPPALNAHPTRHTPRHTPRHTQLYSACFAWGLHWLVARLLLRGMNVPGVAWSELLAYTGYPFVLICVATLSGFLGGERCSSGGAAAAAGGGRAGGRAGGWPGGRAGGPLPRARRHPGACPPGWLRAAEPAHARTARDSVACSLSTACG
jgi:hypothetical protein